MTPTKPQSPGEFRHQLLTPVNHIIGYAELLIEEAEAEGQTDILAALHPIHAEGHKIFGTIQKSVADEGTLPPGFAAQLVEMCERIIAECDRLGPSAEASREDLLKIRSAAEELIGLSAGTGTFGG